MSNKGGSQTTKSEVPEFIKDAGQFGVNRGKQLSQLGYMPYFGPDVAALSPMEYAGMQNTNNAASAFGMAAPGMGGGMQQGMAQQGGGGQPPAQVGNSPEAIALAELYQQNLGRAPDQAGYDFWKGQLDGGMGYNEIANRFANSPESRQADPMTGLPVAGNFGGFNAYSSGPMYQGAIDQAGQRMPGLLDYYNSMFIDPQTGDAPVGSVPAANANDTSRGSGGSTRDRNYRNRDRDRGGSSSDYMRDNQMTSGSGGGFDSIRDMFDGGGAGRSGDTFKGGPLSGRLNDAGVRPVKGRR